MSKRFSEVWIQRMWIELQIQEIFDWLKGDRTLCNRGLWTQDINSFKYSQFTNHQWWCNIQYNLSLCPILSINSIWCPCHLWFSKTNSNTYRISNSLHIHSTWSQIPLATCIQANRLPPKCLFSNNNLKWYHSTMYITGLQVKMTSNHNRVCQLISLTLCKAWLPFPFSRSTRIYISHLWWMSGLSWLGYKTTRPKRRVNKIDNNTSKMLNLYRIHMPSSNRNNITKRFKTWWKTDKLRCRLFKTTRSGRWIRKTRKQCRKTNWGRSTMIANLR